MKIAVASGKGGTGKTLVSTNLARVALEKGSVTLYDLDVEEPNDRLFFKFSQLEKQPVEMMIPVVDDTLCEHSGVCSQVCEYHAIITLANQVLVFPELCHSCYGCLEMCPSQAISEGKKEIGVVEQAEQDGLRLISGLLKVGESATTALIRETKKIRNEKETIEIYDAPPGTSCPVIETVKDMDFIILVGEPTPFGLHDLNLMVQVLRDLKKPFGVVINKAMEGNTRLEEYCTEKHIEILTRIPLRSDIAEEYARGNLVCDALSDVRTIFEDLLETVMQKANGELA